MEEREKERDLRDEAKEKNERRTETGKKKFYWRVLDMKLRKWYIREIIEDSSGQWKHRRKESLCFDSYVYKH